MSLNEVDTRAQLIDPKLHEAGWSDSLISREYPISVGRIEIIGETYRRAAPPKADYVLRLGTFTITTAKVTKIPLPLPNRKKSSRI